MLLKSVEVVSCGSPKPDRRDERLLASIENAGSSVDQRFVTKIKQHGVMLALEPLAEHLVAPVLWPA